MGGFIYFSTEVSHAIMDAGDRKNNENMHSVMGVASVSKVSLYMRASITHSRLYVCVCVCVSIHLLAGKLCIYVHE